jgi:predicted nucleic acid-binding protein
VSLVFVDTSIALPGIIGKPSAMNSAECVRARAFFDWLSKSPGTEVAIATPTLAELMLQLAPQAAQQAFSALKNRIRIFPFDERAALLMAKLHAMRLADGELERISKELAIRMRLLRFDLQILAVAKANGATCVYSEDKKMRNFAAGFIDAQPIPAEVVAQQTWLDNGRE